MKYQILPALALGAVIAACEPAEPPMTAEEAAALLAKQSIIVDGHIDVPYKLADEWADVSQATEGRDFDYPRAVAGGLNAPFMSIYTPAEYEAEGKSRETAEELIDLVYRLVDEAPGKFAIALSPDDIEAQFAKGLISLPLGMENGSPIEGDLDNVQHFYDRGIRYITLAHGLSNHISDSSYDPNRQWDGLSEFGEKVVREMNRLGIIVDISHVSDAAFFDVLEVTTAPVIASHSSARHFTPGFERNMSDEMIKALAENGGIIMINYGSGFVTQAANEYGIKRRAAFAEFAAQGGDTDDPQALEALRARFIAENGEFPFATLDEVVDHFEHVIKLVGVDHVGIGSDYDGVGDSLPTGLKDASTYPNLVLGLQQRGISDDDIGKILGGNLLRVWREVEATAANSE